MNTFWWYFTKCCKFLWVICRLPGILSKVHKQLNEFIIQILLLIPWNASDDDLLFPFVLFIQLAGGTASMQQLKERLEKDLLEVSLFWSPAMDFFLFSPPMFDCWIWIQFSVLFYWLRSNNFMITKTRSEI